MVASGRIRLRSISFRRRSAQPVTACRSRYRRSNACSVTGYCSASDRAVSASSTARRWRSREKSGRPLASRQTISPSITIPDSRNRPASEDSSGKTLRHIATPAVLKADVTLLDESRARTPSRQYFENVSGRIERFGVAAYGRSARSPAAGSRGQASQAALQFATARGEVSSPVPRIHLVQKIAQARGVVHMRVSCRRCRSQNLEPRTPEANEVLGSRF